MDDNEVHVHDTNRFDGTCLSCHVRGVNLGFPRDHATRTPGAMPRRPNNSYEKGVPTSKRPDGSEMPYLRADGETMYQREFDAKRHQIEENRKRMMHQASSSSTN
jgi:hypothetical protein